MTAALAHGSTMSTSFSVQLLVPAATTWAKTSSTAGARQLELTPMRLSRRTIGPQSDPSGARSLRHRFSLTAANALLLNRAGVRAANTEVSGICTKCDGDHWFSHRGQGAQTGRFGAMISIRGE